MEFVRSWVEKSPYASALGVALDALTESSARLSLAYSDDNSNPGKALHGGCAASLAAIGAQAVARAALGEEAGPWHTCGLQINYLSAAIGEDVIAEATLLRRGKELCFVEVSVKTADARPIAHATSAVRGRFGAEAAPPVRCAGDDGASDPGPMGRHIQWVPFMAKRSITVEHMAGGRSRITLPLSEANRDAGGGMHEGAVLALLDTTGAMASWAETGPGRYKASTPAVQAQIIAPPPGSDLVGYGRVVRHDPPLFWSDVEIATAAEAETVARGTVLYRIVT